MPDHLTPEQRSRAMKRVRLKNGSLEVLVQQGLKACGLKFRKNVRNLPGSPDIVFHKLKVAVFIDGDFWHGWRLSTWQHKLKPFWLNKILTNRARDQRNFRLLRASGWRVIRIWQHQLKRDRAVCIQRIEEALKSRCKVDKTVDKALEGILPRTETSGEIQSQTS